MDTLPSPRFELLCSQTWDCSFDDNPRLHLQGSDTSLSSFVDHQVMCTLKCTSTRNKRYTRYISSTLMYSLVLKPNQWLVEISWLGSIWEAHGTHGHSIFYVHFKCVCQIRFFFPLETCFLFSWIAMTVVCCWTSLLGTLQVPSKALSKRLLSYPFLDGPIWGRLVSRAW